MVLPPLLQGMFGSILSRSYRPTPIPGSRENALKRHLPRLAGKHYPESIMPSRAKASCLQPEKGPDRSLAPF